MVLICLVLCPTQEIFIRVMSTIHYRYIAANFDTPDYNGHLRGPVTLTPVAERLAVAL